MLCFADPSMPTVTLCGAPSRSEWWDIALTPDYRRITCRTCRSWWNHEHPEARIPSRERPYVQRYSVTTTEGKLSDLSWEEALLYYRSSRKDQLHRHHASDPDALVACYFMTGDRVIAALLIVGGETVVDTAVGIGLQHLSRGDD